MAKGTVNSNYYSLCRALTKLSLSPATEAGTRPFYLFGIATEQRSTSRNGVAGKRVTQFMCQHLMPVSGFPTLVLSTETRC